MLRLGVQLLSVALMPVWLQRRQHRTCNAEDHRGFESLHRPFESDPMRIVHLIAKDILATEFMQKCDVFESFKFVGRILDLEVEAPAGMKEPTLQDVFDSLRKMPTDHFETVGLVIPNQGAIVLSNHKIFSDSKGRGWITMEKLVKEFGCDSYQEV